MPGGKIPLHATLAQLPMKRRTVYTCLYCQESKDGALFNREHVVPRSFGTYANNHVLHNVVCAECNSYFSSSLELALGRQTFEGIQRFQIGIASPKRARSGTTKHVRISHRGELQEGAILELDLSSASGAIVRPVKQLGFSHFSNGPYKWFRIENLPSKEDLRTQGYDLKALFVQSGGLSDSEVVEYLRGLGLDVQSIENLSESLARDGTIPIRLEGRGCQNFCVT